MMTDPGIILFGKKIGWPETPNTTSLSPFAAATSSSSEERGNTEHTLFTPHVYDQRKDETDDDPRTPSIDEESVSENHRTTDGDAMDLQTRFLKKPEKILPCPRCESMDTKFCYFNNSNVNQPRHFCKSCQRYWTAGGTMRSMPVGAGRRKKKNPPAHCRYIIAQEAFESESEANRIEFAPDSEGISRNVFSFGQNSPSGKENRDDNNGFQSQIHWIPGVSWPYNPWNTPTPIPMPISPYPPGYPPSPYWSSVSWLPATNSILGKHPTDVEAIKPNDSNEEFKKQRNSILIPKTLRVDDPDEAAKSSIWAALGIKNEHSGRGDLFKAFQSKGNEEKKYKATEPSPVLQANPAAFSRSLCFQERV